MSLDLEGYDWIKERPLTTAYRDMCSMFSPVETLFMADYIKNSRWLMIDGDVADKTKSIDVKCQDLFDEYVSFCRTNKFKEDTCPNSRAFCGRMIGLELPMNKIKKRDTTYWKFTPNEVYKFMENTSCLKRQQSLQTYTLG